MSYKTNRLLIACLFSFALAGCDSQSDIQSKYMRQQSECRGSSQLPEMGDDAATPVDTQRSNALLVKQFSDCMNKAGWHVAAPKLPAAAAPAVPPPQPQPAAPVATRPTALTPAQPMPPLSPPVSGAATYQPARPEGASQVPYGTGAGRQF